MAGVTRGVAAGVARTPYDKTATEYCRPGTWSQPSQRPGPHVWVEGRESLLLRAWAWVGDAASRSWSDKEGGEQSVEAGGWDAGPSVGPDPADALLFDELLEQVAAYAELFRRSCER